MWAGRCSECPAREVAGVLVAGDRTAPVVRGKHGPIRFMHSLSPVKRFITDERRGSF